MKNLKALIALTAVAVLMVLTVVSCGRFEAPTASQPTTNAEMGLWNPAAGDQVAGHDIPRLNPGYWESVHGSTVNPWFMGPRPVFIGPAGGIVRLGWHLLIVPPGAVDDWISFTMTYASQTAIGVDCGPSPFTFNVPVILILSFIGTQYQNSDQAADLDIYYMTPDGELEAQPSQVNLGARTVIAEVDHFSRYILG